jgi:hypothetical protein
MASTEPDLKLSNCLGISEVPAGDLVIAPFDGEVAALGRAEPTTQAVIEGIEIAAELAAGTVYRLTDEPPELFQARNLCAFQGVDHRHNRRISGCHHPAPSSFCEPDMTAVCPTGLRARSNSWSLFTGRAL